MNSAQAKARSAELVESGYAEWLEERMREQGVAMFASAGTTAELERARIVYDMAGRVRNIILDNAR